MSYQDESSGIDERWTAVLYLQEWLNMIAGDGVVVELIVKDRFELVRKCQVIYQSAGRQIFHAFDRNGNSIGWFELK